MMLTDIECRTLDSLYPDKAAYFEFLYQISDRVQEDEGEVAAEGVRFLFFIKSRPRWANTGGFSGGWPDDTVGWYGVPDRSKNLASVFKQYSSNGCDQLVPSDVNLWGCNRFPSPSAAVQEFLKRWCGLDQEVRERISKEWVLETVNN